MASVYPNIKNGKIVSFKLKVFLGRAENGKQIFKCKTWIPEKAMTENKLRQTAEKAATIWEKEVVEQYKNEKSAFVPAEITLRDFAEKVWFPSRMSERDHSASTIAFHGYLLKTILDYLGKTKIIDIKPNHISNYLDYLKNTYKTKNNRTVSAKTIKHHYCTLNLIFEYAVKIEYLKANPLKKTDTPKLTKHKVDALSKGEVSIFINELKNLPLEHQTIYMLLLTTGLRRGECYGLQWKDIDFANSLINVERNVTYTSRSGITVGLPKTSAGIRKIPLTNQVAKLLEKLKQENEMQHPLTDNMFVFPSTSSPTKPHDPTYITKHMRKFMQRIGLPDMSPHDLRHTCASLLLQSGADIKSVQDILGHADACTTLNFYVKSDIDTMKRVTENAFEI